MGKKRIIIVLLLSAIFMVATSSLYIKNKGIKIWFNYQTAETSTAEVSFSKNDIRPFAAPQKITFSQYTHTTILKVHINKLRKLQIKFSEKNNIPEIKQIKIRGRHKITLSNIYSGADSLKKNVLTISLPKTIKNKTSLDVKIFIILLTISVLFSFKLIQYLSRFKIIDKNSRIDIVFVVAFFLLITFPVLFISNKTVSNQENRTLAVYKPLIKNNEINIQYGTDFENWYNDHFFQRNFFIKLYNKINLYLKKHYSTERYYIGKNKWMFIKAHYNTYVPFNEQNTSKIVNNIKQLQQFCKENKIDLYFLIVPEKENILLSEQLDKIGTIKKENIYDLNSHILAKTGIKLIYPKQEMIKANQTDLVFFQTDHHWTEWGALIGYQALMKELQKKYPSLPLVGEQDFNSYYDYRIKAEYDQTFFEGSVCKAAGLSSANCNAKVPYKYYATNNKLKKEDDAKTKKRHFFNSTGEKNITIIGTSFTENFSVFLPYSFRNTLKLRANNGYQQEGLFKMSRFENDILNNKTNILVFVLDAYYLPELTTLY